jgi:hypothetical protein
MLVSGLSYYSVHVDFFCFSYECVSGVGIVWGPIHWSIGEERTIRIDDAYWYGLKKIEGDFFCSFRYYCHKHQSNTAN